MIHRLFVPGVPVAWSRARRCGNQHFKLKALAEWQAHVRRFARDNPPPGAPLAGSLRIDMAFFLPMPSDWSRKKCIAMSGMPVAVKPDKDNLEKAVLDALAADKRSFWDGWFKMGDQQVAAGCIGKWYVSQRDLCGVKIDVGRAPAWDFTGEDWDSDL